MVEVLSRCVSSYWKEFELSSSSGFVRRIDFVSYRGFDVILGVLEPKDEPSKDQLI